MADFFDFLLSLFSFGGTTGGGTTSSGESRPDGEVLD